LEQYYSPSDLSKFQTQNNLPNQQPTVVGTNDANKPGTEASLDIEYIMGVATNIKTFFIYTNGTTGGQEPFLDWIIGMNNASSAPITNSISYGDTEASLTADYMNRINVEFQKFGVTGHSILFASGDSGVGCTACKSFSPDFPASSPYVTAVGGTQLSGSASTAVEVGVDFGGGGFSNTFATPSYQQTAVQQYLSSNSLPPSSFFNASGRGYPDIAYVITDRISH
jgi:tripeptidyl-peptidase I